MTYHLAHCDVIDSVAHRDSVTMAERAQLYLESLQTALQIFAKHGSNPTLSVIPSDNNIVNEKKYPESYLTFAANGFMAYYHVHDFPSINDKEHGHFHLFYSEEIDSQTTLDKYAHVVCLSMDKLGQPIQLSTVNQWVTAGQWLQADDLSNFYRSVDNTLDAADTALNTVETWLLALLGILKNSINTLYMKRDAYIQRLATDDENVISILENRSVYCLSRESIDIKKSLIDFYSQHM